MKTWTDWYWFLWLVIGFVPLETWMLFQNHEGTLSDTVWNWFGVKEGVPISHWSFLHFFLLAFMAWLFFHFVMGWFR